MRRPSSRLKQVHDGEAGGKLWPRKGDGEGGGVEPAVRQGERSAGQLCNQRL